MQSGFPDLIRWANFYVITGSSAGALTGLQFVVIALLSQMGGVGNRHQIRAFGTPTVVHFCAALLISAIMNGPWDGPFSTGICLAILGIAGFGYALSVWRSAKSQTGYSPDVEDWLWYIVFPLIAYAALAAAGFLLARSAAIGLPGTAAVTLLLLFVGIHNSWDTATFVALKNLKAPKDPTA